MIKKIDIQLKQTQWCEYHMQQKKKQDKKSSVELQKA
jgi:hypothetical protein